MQFVLKIDLQPEIMESGAQVAEALRQVADGIDHMVGHQEPSQIMSARIIGPEREVLGEWRFIE